MAADTTVDKDLIPLDNGSDTDDKSTLNESNPDSNIFDDFFSDVLWIPKSVDDPKKADDTDKAPAASKDEFANPDKDPAIYETYIKGLQETIKSGATDSAKLSELTKFQETVNKDEFLKKVVEKMASGEITNLSKSFTDYVEARSKSTANPDKARGSGDNRSSGKAQTIDEWLWDSQTQGYNHKAK